MKLPPKQRLREIADELWRVAVRRRWHNRCAICAKWGTEAHHLIPRANAATRYEVDGGIALCRAHHQYDPDLSPHKKLPGFLEWLAWCNPSIYSWHFFHHHDRFTGTVNADYYCEAIRNLRRHIEPEDFERIVGKRLAKWLTENS